ncbi:hypothetical protein DPEC_G00058170 [Dallia pectoralis]|uniref:Uncharacterized protein n=1 Tax=Dallia pectoralis TaxID=75939 RepID=A0ACC2H646_DALPE|nr:hypothetical protein DPEC_G00058170 [Dallia pectoralis]
MTSMNKHRREVCVFLPNKDQLNIVVGVKTTGQEVFSHVFNLLDIQDLYLFGLTMLRDDEHVFLDLEQKLTKYFGNKWRRNSSKDPVHLFMKVQYYIEHSQLILKNKPKSFYYADLRHRVLHSQCHYQEPRLFQLAAYALQADLGDLPPKEGRDVITENKVEHYFQPEDYFPHWIVKRRGRDYLLQHTPSLHDDLRGVSQPDAMSLYIKEASTLQDVPVTLYRIRTAKNKNRCSVILSLALNGIQLYQEVDGIQHLLYNFSWSDIDRFTFQGRKFRIQALGSLCVPELLYNTTSAFHSKHMLKHLSGSHRLHMNTRDTLSKLQCLEDSQGCVLYSEAYICDRGLLSPNLHCSQDSLTSSDTTDYVWQPCLVRETAQNTDPRSMSEPKCSGKEFEQCVDEPEPVSVDDLEWMMLLSGGVSVDEPLLTPVSHWADVTTEMKQVLKLRSYEGVSVD